MADEFTAKITAELDTSKLQSELATVFSNSKVKVQLDSADIQKQIEYSFNGQKITFNAKNVDMSGITQSMTKSLTGVEKQANSIMSQITLGNLDKQISSLSKGTLSVLNINMKGQIAEAVVELNRLQDAMRDCFTKQDYSGVVSTFNEFNNVLKANTNDLNTYKNLMSEVESVAKDLTKYDTQSLKMDQQLEMFKGMDSSTLNDMRSYAKEYSSIVQDLQKDYDKDTGQFKFDLIDEKTVLDDKARLNELNQLFSNSMAKIKTQTEGINLGKMFDNLKTGGYERTLNDLTSQITKLGKAGTQAGLDQTKNNLSALYSEMMQAYEIGDWDTLIAKTREFESEAANAKSTLTDLGNTDFSTTLVGSFNNIASTMNKVLGYNFIYREIRKMGTEMVSTVKEIDTAMNQLQIVTGASDNEMTTFFESSIDMAKELGQSVTDVLDSVQVYSRLGYDLADASELAEYTSILSNVAAVDVDEATTGLTSVIKGFDLEVSDAEHIADVLTDIGQNYAVSASEILEAFQNSSAAFGATGTSFEEAAAIIAAGNAAVQNASLQTGLEVIEIYLKRMLLIARTA